MASNIERDVYLSWSDLKDRATLKILGFQYHENTQKYTIYIEDGQTIYFTFIYMAGEEPTGVDVSQNTSDRTDFETNYQADANQATYIKSLMVGLNIDGDVTNASVDKDPVDAKNRVAVESKTADTGQLDSFGRLRVGNPESVFEAQFLFDAQPSLFTTVIIGGGVVAHNANISSVDLSVTAANGDSAVLRSRAYWKYHSGKSQSIVFTGNFNTADSNCRRRYGQFDADNGFYFQYTDTMSIGLRTSTSGSPVDIIVAQSSWNLDPLDGTGPSGLTLDPTLQQIFHIDYQWLGSGRVRYGFVIGGRLTYVHEINNANTLPVPYSQSATLPLKFEVVNTGTLAGPITSHVTCMTIYSEGGFTPEGASATVNTGASSRPVTNGTDLPLISIRKAPGFLKIPIKLFGIDVFADSADDLLVTIVLNATLTGAVWTPKSRAEYDISATSYTGGIEAFSFHLRGSNIGSSVVIQEDFFNLTNLTLGSDLAGNSDIMTVAIKTLTGNANVRGSINFKELT